MKKADRKLFINIAGWWSTVAFGAFMFSMLTGFVYWTRDAEWMRTVLWYLWYDSTPR